MFDKTVYIQRRRRLVETLSGRGLVLFVGNLDSPMNYPANCYDFRQDGSFRYYWGLNEPGLAGLIDLDSGQEILLGDDLTVEQIVWMGYQPTLVDKAGLIGVNETRPYGDLKLFVQQAVRQGRPIYLLPVYRADIRAQLTDWLSQPPQSSEALIRAVVAQRSVKDDLEIQAMEASVAVACEMQTAVMAAGRPGVKEGDLKGVMDSILASHGCKNAFPTIVTVRGEILHNTVYINELQEGQWVVNDSGVESPEGYTSDLTRTFPVSGRFDSRQRDIYQIVLAAQEQAIAAIKPGIPFKDIHWLACMVVTEGLIQMGLMKGNAGDAVSAGAHALFFPYGLGHMLGMDTHDMEGLGENYVGYDDTVARSQQFGLRSLRMARALRPGFVVTVEPGIYFIPPLIQQWKTKETCREFIDFGRVESFIGIGGVRIEDDILVTGTGHRVLGPIPPKTIEAVEQACRS